MACLLGLMIKGIQPKVLGRGELDWPTDLDSDCPSQSDYSEEAGVSAGLVTAFGGVLVPQEPLLFPPLGRLQTP